MGEKKREGVVEEVMSLCSCSHTFVLTRLERQRASVRASHSCERSLTWREGEGDLPVDTDLDGHDAGVVRLWVWVYVGVQWCG